MNFVDARPAYRWLRIETEKFSARHDAIFVVGGGSEAPLYRAMELYENGYAKVIAFTSCGGNFGGNLVWGHIELEYYRNFFQKRGVPPSALFSPRASGEWTNNTLDEARTAVPFLTRCLKSEPRNIILCSRPVHQRRAWLTFRKQHPGIKYTNCPGDELLSVELLPRIMGELKRIREYGYKGDTERCAIPDEVLIVEKKLLALGITG